QYCYAYKNISSIKTILTIHNAEYQGWMDWGKANYIPDWDKWKYGLLDWRNTINALACGIKCASKVNTVSHGYLEELRYNANGLESLFNYERGKCFGILNGIDNEVWNPQTDHYLDVKFGTHDFKEGKSKNKKDLCMKFNLDENKPLIIFIGRLVGEKAADLLPAVIGDSIHYMEGRMNFLVLGSGEWYIEDQLSKMQTICLAILTPKSGITNCSATGCMQEPIFY